MAMQKPANFVTFGMFIVDEIEWPPSKGIEPVHNLIGGAGTYAVLGARLASSPCQILSKNISWIVDVGSDFPPEIKATIDKWNTDCIYRSDDTRLTTRAINSYEENDYRNFKYLTPKIRLEVASLNNRQLLSKAFHMVCSPTRCEDLVGGLKQARLALGEQSSPFVIWEPIPDLCTAEELGNARRVASLCAVVSTNYEELKSFFPIDRPIAPEKEVNAQHLLVKIFRDGDSTAPYRGVFIVREGSKGSTAYTQLKTPLHFPAYHDESMQHSVIDPTGAGNAYLGALAISLSGALFDQPAHDLIVRRMRRIIPKFFSKGRKEYEKPDSEASPSLDTIVVAMIYATITASFIVEQHGVPTLESSRNFIEIVERWNGETFIERVNKYFDREEPLMLERLPHSSPNS